MGRKLFSSLLVSAVDQNLNEIRKEIRLWFKGNPVVKSVKFSGNDATVVLEHRNSTMLMEQIKDGSKSLKRALMKVFPNLTITVDESWSNEEDLITFVYHLEFSKKPVKSSTMIGSSDQSDFRQAAHNIRMMPEFQKAYRIGKISHSSALQNFLYDLDKEYNGSILQPGEGGYDIHTVMGLVRAIMKEDVEVNGWQSPYHGEMQASTNSSRRTQTPEVLLNSLLVGLDKLEQIAASKKLDNKTIDSIRSAYNIVLDTRQILQC